MKVKLLFALLLTLVTTATVKGKTFVPVGSRLNIEGFYKKIDLNMDISQLSLSDLRLLRNGFAARQGYCFSDYALRAIYSQTSWYDSIMGERECNGSMPPIKYTKAEVAFMDKIKAREAELKRQNFMCKAGEMVNVDNIVNLFQLEEVSEPLNRRLARDGFAIVPRNNIQLFHCYENNDYHDFPNFITTDMYLQLFHLYFSRMLREVESKRLSPLMSDFFSKMYAEMSLRLSEAKKEPAKKAAAFGVAYFSIACKLIGRDSITVPEQLRPTVDSELAKIQGESDTFSEFLGYTDTYFLYSKFRPRGYYTSNDTLKRYFRAMSWMQLANKCAGSDEFLLMADVLNNQPGLRQLLERISAPLQLLVGQPDDVSLLDLAAIVEKMGTSFDEISKNKRLSKAYRQAVDELAQSRTRILPKKAVSCLYKECIMPQRYLYDSEVLQELVDVKTQPISLRAYPMGLDVMAAFGSQQAADIVAKDVRWPEYVAKLDSVKALMPQLSSDSTVYNMWMKSLAVMLNDTNKSYPYFMKTPQWGKKNLNTALASWAELRHDVLLYAKQPMAAECGGCIPDPVVVGYVEPNVAYWAKAVELVRHTADVLTRNDLFTDRARTLTTQMEEQAAFLLSVSQKELEGERLSESEYYSIEKLGSTYEYITIEMLKGDDAGDGMTWSDIDGTGKSVSVVADVYTANSANNPQKGVLEEGVGYVDDIFVVVEIGGMLHLTRGAVFSYRELRSGMNNRLTDEQWQKMLETSPRRGVPEWMDEILLPDEVPADNETVFYSSGC